MILATGCHLLKGRTPKEKTPVLKIEKMVVVGFRPVLASWEGPDVVRSPLSGAVFMAEPVPERVVNQMTADLFDRIMNNKSYDLISPSQAKGVYETLVSSDVVSGDIELSQRIGEAFSADAVLIGYLYRWREREGTDYGVERAASVAFDLYLIRPHDGAILWKGKFDKTQRSLSENLFDMDTFVKGGGRWMTVGRLAEVGLENLLGKFPKSYKGEED